MQFRQNIEKFEDYNQLQELLYKVNFRTDRDKIKGTNYSSLNTITSEPKKDHNFTKDKQETCKGSKPHIIYYTKIIESLLFIPVLYTTTMAPNTTKY